MSAFIDLTGRRFGRLEVIERMAKSSEHQRHTKWRCMCVCGHMKNVFGHILRRGSTTSCGCYRSEVLRELRLKHGHARSVRNGTEDSGTYRSWYAMIKRCHNPKSVRYRRYGGRGITVCERWRNDFRAFLTDMGPRPAGAFSIDRINNDGNYELGNCRWASPKEQARNKRNNHRLTINGETLTVSEWAEKSKLRPLTILTRLRRGWHPEKAVFSFLRMR